VQLTPQEMDAVKAALDRINPNVQSKPREWGCG
jgi:hypothetical protein